MAKASCPMMDLPIANRFVAPIVEYLQHCERWRGEIMSRLRAEHPKLVVVSVFRGYTATHSNGFLSGFSSYDRAWVDGLKGLVQQLRGIGTKVMVLGPLPHLNAAVPGCLSEHPTDAMACAPPMSTDFDRAGMAAEAPLSSRWRAVRRPHRSVLHQAALSGHHRQHPGVRRRGSPDPRIFQAAGADAGGAVRPGARRQRVITFVHQHNAGITSFSNPRTKVRFSGVRLRRGGQTTYCSEFNADHR